MAVFNDLEQRGLFLKLMGTAHLNLFAKYLITKDQIEGILRAMLTVVLVI